MARTPGIASVWTAFTGIWEGKAFRLYLHRRGYRTCNDGAFFRRAFLECWAEPGFHRFWRVWNPGLGFLVFRLYRALGGNRRGPLSKVVAFLASGVAHNLLVLPILGWSFTLPVAFASAGVMAVLGPNLSRFLRLHRWPAPLNAAVNVALVVGCLSAGFRVDDWIRGGC